MEERINRIKSIRDFIFTVEYEDIPRYINETLLAPILKWRLQQSI